MGKTHKKKQHVGDNKGENKMMNMTLRKNSSEIKDRILLLKKRALKRNSNPELRHMPSSNDVEKANAIFKDLEHEIYSNIFNKKD